MILGLNGLMRAGKNTVAERLAVLSPLQVIEVSYARKLKESVSVLFDISLEDIEVMKNNLDCKVVLGDWHGYDNAITFRHFLQRYGTEAHRNTFGQDFWLDEAMPLDKDYSDALYVVTDVRFDNEAKRIRDLGGEIMYIVGNEDTAGTHQSETVLPDPEWTLFNDIRDDGFASLDERLGQWLDLNIGYAMGAQS